MLFQLIIPCYNEADSLAYLIQRTAQAAKNASLAPEQFQLILVDNGSTDETAAMLATLAQGALGPWFQVVTVAQNKGYGDGIFQGLKASTAPVIGWTHADGQCDPADAFHALAVLRASAHPVRTVVKGRRIARAVPDFLWSRVFELLAMVLLRSWLWEVNAQPKVFSRHLLKELADPPADFAFDLYALYRARRAGWLTITFPVVFSDRLHGVSHWASSLSSRLRTGMKMLRYMTALRQQEKRK